ncbi:MAG: protein translocase subunit SecD [Rhodobacteraceae bacterium]|nr:protein translocase subunit SecD [Paracoccaceae bacterium]
MLHIPVWKRVVIIGLCLAAIVVALPNLFYARVESHNDALRRIEQTGATTDADAAALALWPSWMPSRIVNLGLDLRGGAHLLAEVAVADVYKTRIEGLWPDARKALTAVRADVGGIRRVAAPDGELRIRIENPAGLPKAVEALRALARPVATLTGVGEDDLVVTGTGDTVSVTLSDAEKAATDARTMQQSVEIVRRRVDEVGTREPTIQRQGEDRILIEVPGIGSAAELKALIGTTAQLTFHPVIRITRNPDESPGPDGILVPSADEKDLYYVLERAPVVTGEDLVDARPDFDQNGRPAVAFRFNPSGGQKFGDYTAENIGNPFAIVLDNEVISAPTIQAHIAGGSGIITGNFTVEESTNLAVLLRAGALPAGMTFLEERTVGPELGADSIHAGKIAAVVGYAAVGLYMIASYGFFGVVATFALALNVVMIFAIFALIGSTLTLPGIAAIVLTMGMAVDANVLVYERIREELRRGSGPAKAIDVGYSRAMSAIWDSNLTTIIAAAIMFYLGSGPIKGFAVALTVGIVTSMFTALNVTRLIIVTWFGWRRPRTLVV